MTEEGGVVIREILKQREALRQKQRKARIKQRAEEMRIRENSAADNIGTRKSSMAAWAGSQRSSSRDIQSGQEASRLIARRTSVPAASPPQKKQSQFTFNFPDKSLNARLAKVVD